MKQFILASLLLAVSQMAVGVSWIDVGLSSKRDKEKTYIDLDTFGAVKINQNIYVSAWVKQDYPVLRRLPDGRVYSSETTLNYFDCNYRKRLVVE